MNELEIKKENDRKFGHFIRFIYLFLFFLSQRTRQKCTKMKNASAWRAGHAGITVFVHLVCVVITSSFSSPSSLGKLSALSDTTRSWGSSYIELRLSGGDDSL